LEAKSVQVQQGCGDEERCGGTMKAKLTGFLWDATHTLGVFGHKRVDATFVDRELYFVVVPRDAHSPNL